MDAIGEMHDRQIVATTLHVIARRGSAALFTADAEIHRSGIVPIVW